jgi:hypothetical protein
MLEAENLATEGNGAEANLLAAAFSALPPLSPSRNAIRKQPAAQRKLNFVL